MFARYVCVRERVLAADADVSLAVVEDRGAMKLVPRGRGDGEWCNDEGARAIGAGLGDEGVEEGRGGVGEEGLAVWLGAMWAQGKRPVRRGEGVFDLGAWLGVAGKKPRDKGFGLGDKGISGDGPADVLCKAPNLFPKERRADRSGHVKGAGTREVIDALVHEGAPGRVQEQLVAADETLEATGAHGALLQEGGREATFPECLEGRNGAVLILVGFRANGRGEQGNERSHVWQAREVVLDAATQGGELRECGLPAVEKSSRKAASLASLSGGMDSVRWKVSTTMQVYVTSWDGV